MGTRFIASAECNAHDVYKRKVLEAQEEDTVRTTLFGNGWPNAWHRTLRTDFVRQWLPQEQRGSEQRGDEPRFFSNGFRGVSANTGPQVFLQAQR